MNIIIRKNIILLLVVIISPITILAKNTDKKTSERLKADIAYLASPELEGRRTSTQGETQTADFIEKRYKDLGIGGYNGHYQFPFRFIYGREVSYNTSVRINNSQLSLKKECFPLPFSGSKNIKGETILDFNQKDKIWLLPLYADKEQAASPHFEWEKSMNLRAREAEQRGATGVIFYDPYGAKYEPYFKVHTDFEQLGIPVIFINHTAFEKYLKTIEGKSVSLELKIGINNAERLGTNVAAYIDNKALYTVIVGAHYDHLGFGEDGNSLFDDYPVQHIIHPGADDNASGTAALLEEALWIKENKKMKNFNYMFVNFSGEELGLYGSKAFIKDFHIDSANIAYMLNMDMVGRLDKGTKMLTLGGVGTSSDWGDVVQMAGKDFNLVIDSNGRGPSDHTSFYNAGIPVLFFFTGTHEDYHRPTDVCEKINYDGEVKVIEYIERVLQKIDEKNIKPKYISTNTSSLGKVDFKVTLGIVPDYTSQGGGVRIDGVMDNRPAANAGVRKGDVIIKLGNYKIQGMQSYMEALSRFSPGERTFVSILRNGKEIVLPIVLTGK